MNITEFLQQSENGNVLEEVLTELIPQLQAIEEIDFADLDSVWEKLKGILGYKDAKDQDQDQNNFDKLKSKILAYITFWHLAKDTLNQAIEDFDNEDYLGHFEKMMGLSLYVGEAQQRVNELIQSENEQIETQRISRNLVGEELEQEFDKKKIDNFIFGGDDVLPATIILFQTIGDNEKINQLFLLWDKLHNFLITPYATNAFEISDFPGTNKGYSLIQLYSSLNHITQSVFREDERPVPEEPTQEEQRVFIEFIFKELQKIFAQGEKDKFSELRNKTYEAINAIIENNQLDKNLRQVFFKEISIFLLKFKPENITYAEVFADYLTTRLWGYEPEQYKDEFLAIWQESAASEFLSTFEKRQVRSALISWYSFNRLKDIDPKEHAEEISVIWNEIATSKHLSDIEKEQIHAYLRRDKRFPDDSSLPSYGFRSMVQTSVEPDAEANTQLLDYALQLVKQRNSRNALKTVADENLSLPIHVFHEFLNDALKQINEGNVGNRFESDKSSFEGIINNFKELGFTDESRPQGYPNKTLEHLNESYNIYILIKQAIAQVIVEESEDLEAITLYLTYHEKEEKPLYQHFENIPGDLRENIQSFAQAVVDKKHEEPEVNSRLETVLEDQGIIAKSKFKEVVDAKLNEEEVDDAQTVLYKEVVQPALKDPKLKDEFVRDFVGNHTKEEFEAQKIPTLTAHFLKTQDPYGRHSVPHFSELKKANAPIYKDKKFPVIDRIVNEKDQIPLRRGFRRPWQRKTTNTFVPDQHQQELMTKIRSMYQLHYQRMVVLFGEYDPNSEIAQWRMDETNESTIKDFFQTLDMQNGNPVEVFERFLLKHENKARLLLDERFQAENDKLPEQQAEERLMASAILSFIHQYRFSQQYKKSFSKKADATFNSINKRNWLLGNFPRDWSEKVAQSALVIKNGSRNLESELSLLKQYAEEAKTIISKLPRRQFLTKFSLQRKLDKLNTLIDFLEDQLIESQVQVYEKEMIPKLEQQGITKNAFYEQERGKFNLPAPEVVEQEEEETARNLATEVVGARIRSPGR